MQTAAARREGDRAEGIGRNMPDSTTVEIDFFQMERQNGSPPRLPSGRAGSSCRRIQNVFSKINPALLKTVMAGGDAVKSRCADGTGLWMNGRPLQSSNLPSPTAAPEPRRSLSPLPVLNPASRFVVHGHDPETAPLTIFYNGMVTAFDVTSDGAEAIIRMAESGIVEKLQVERPEEPTLDDHQVEGDLPIARRKSLQRFLEKRKERYRAPAEPFSSSLSSMHGSLSEHMMLQNK